MNTMAVWLVMAALYAALGLYMNRAWGIDPSRSTPAQGQGAAGWLRLLAGHAASGLGAGALAGAVLAAEAGAGFAALCAVLGGAAVAVPACGALFASVRHDGAPLGGMMEEHMGALCARAFRVLAQLALALLAAAAADLAACAVAEAAALLLPALAAAHRGVWLAAALAAGLACACLSEGGLRRAGGSAAAALLAAFVIALSFGAGRADAIKWDWIAPGAGVSRLASAAACSAFAGLHALLGTGCTARRIASERHILRVALGGVLLQAAVCVLTLLAGGAGQALAAAAGLPPAAVRAALLLAVAAFALDALQKALRLTRSMARDRRSPSLGGLRPRFDAGRLLPAACFVLSAALALAGYARILPLAAAASLCAAAAVCQLLAVWFRRIGRGAGAFLAAMLLLAVPGLSAAGLALLGGAGLGVGCVRAAAAAVLIAALAALAAGARELLRGEL